MARKTRKEWFKKNGVFHLFWQAMKGEWPFDTPLEQKLFLDAMDEALTEVVQDSMELFSFCLMSSHPHNTGRLKNFEPSSDPDKAERGELDFETEGLSQWMKAGHQRFATGFNTRHDRRGKLASDRAKTPEIKEGGLLGKMIYGDLNPVVAGMVSRPEQYRCSSYNFYAHGKRSKYTEKLTIPEEYLALGDTPEQRRREYRKLVYREMKDLGLLEDVPEGPPDPADVESGPSDGNETVQGASSSSQSGLDGGEVGTPIE